jgi:hypothetical protein
MPPDNQLIITVQLCMSYNINFRYCFTLNPLSKEGRSMLKKHSNEMYYIVGTVILLSVHLS